MTTPRFPLEPLAEHLKITLGCHGRQPGSDGGTGQDDPAEHGLAALALALGISHRTARRLHAHGLSERQADLYAIRSGTHPALLWPEWCEVDDDDSPEGSDDWFADNPHLDELDQPPTDPYQLILAVAS